MKYKEMILLESFMQAHKLLQPGNTDLDSTLKIKSTLKLSLICDSRRALANKNQNILARILSTSFKYLRI